MARFPVKHHGKHNKSPKPIILIVAEGHNVTETLYFKQFQKQHADYNIKLLMPGSSTDPKGMLSKNPHSCENLLNSLSDYTYLRTFVIMGYKWLSQSLQ